VGVLVIAAVVFAVVTPKFSGLGFSESRFAEETAAALRYARSSAVGMQRTVCVEFLSTTSLRLRYKSAYGSGTCDTDLAPPGGGTAPFTVSASGSAAFSAQPADFSFDRIGAPSFASTLTITFNDSRTVVVEKESGFVR
jgi:Tfp pilus assembly protein FimT